MSCLVLEAAPPIRLSLLAQLRSLGIKGIPAGTAEEAETALKLNPDIGAAVVDTDTPGAGGMELLVRLRRNPATQHIRVVAHSGQSTREFIRLLAELGAAGYLPHGASQEMAAERLRQALDRTGPHESERKHLRVRPDPNDLLRIHFRLSGHKGIVSGRIVDISMGGMGVELFHPPPPIRMQPGRVIPTLEFMLGTRTVTTPGVLVTSRGKFCAIRFDNMSSAVKDTLARYIYRQTSS
jgi:CheY-like chemotaxis protein